MDLAAASAGKFCILTMCNYRIINGKLHETDFFQNMGDPVILERYGHDHVKDLFPQACFTLIRKRRED